MLEQEQRALDRLSKMCGTAREVCTEDAEKVEASSTIEDEAPQIEALEEQEAITCESGTEEAGEADSIRSLIEDEDNPIPADE